MSVAWRKAYQATAFPVRITVTVELQDGSSSEASFACKPEDLADDCKTVGNEEVLAYQAAKLAKNAMRQLHASDMRMQGIT